MRLSSELYSLGTIPRKPDSSAGFEHYVNWLRGWKNFRAQPEKYFVIDDGRILVFVHNTARGRASGVELEQRSVANYFEIRDGKVTRLVLYWDRDRAFADLGIASEGDSC